MQNRLGSGFILGNSGTSTSSSVSYSNSNTLIYDNNTFFGIKSFHMESEETLILSSAKTATSLTVSSPNSMEYLLMSYIIFVSDTCPPPKFTHPVDGSCVTSCPSGFLGNSTTSLCQSCSSSCSTCSVFTSNCTGCPDSTTFLQSGSCRLCSSSSSLSHCL